MLRIWGRLTSINVQKVVWCADESGVAFERIDVGGTFGGLDTPQFLALNPNRKIPAIEDGDVVLWESNVIVRYLAARHAAGTLYPGSPAERGRVDQWMDWQQTELGRAMTDAFTQLVRTPEPERDMRRVEASARATEPVVAILDHHLAARAFVAGDRFTMGDIPVGLQVHRWLGLPLERTPRPHVEAWYARLRQRAGAQRVLSLPVR